MQPIAYEIWDMKYRLRGPDGEPVDYSLADTHRRVAVAAAQAEADEEARALWADRYCNALADFGFIPGGRILAGAGSDRQVTLFNCFVMERLRDDLGSIFDLVRDSALTMQMGGGIGVDFTPLRPRGAPVAGVGADASGPVSFMDVWDAMCRTIKSAGARRGAMMATLRADHPDIFEFIAAKTEPGRLTNFNLSVLVPDALMHAVAADASWDLVFSGTVYRTVRARDLWQRIMRATYDAAEPGVIFIDRVNRLNNLGYCETIEATNPCGEQPLPPSGACLLGALNLTRFVTKPFSDAAQLDEKALAERTRIAVRLLDNVIDVSLYPLAEQRREAHAKRRIGLGLTGLADALVMCGLRYGSEEAAERAAAWMRVVQRTAYLASADLAAERGAFPLYEAEAFAANGMLERLGPEVRQAVARHGLRNGCLTTIAPTGTISLLAGNVSSGVEPIFDLSYTRRITDTDGGFREQNVEDYAYRLFREHNGAGSELPPAFVCSSELAPADHIRMQAALQPYVDSAISKTINCPEHISFDAFENLYREAYEAGLKGLTTYRPSSLRGSILAAADAPRPKTVAQGVPSGQPGETAPERAVGRGPAEAGQADRKEPSHSPSSSTRAVDASSQARGGPGDVVYLAQPLERAPVLQGATYKLKWPGSDHALYVTVNDVIRDGRRRPFEVFINTKSLEHYAWTVALTRMISAVFRRGGDVTFVAEELQAIFDPQGGRWIGGRYVPSLQAAIGEIIEGHMQSIGFAPPGAEAALENRSEADAAAASAGEPNSNDARAESFDRLQNVDAAGVATGSTIKPDRVQRRSRAGNDQPVRASSQRQCPRCGTAALVRREGCWTCARCGYSQCD